MINLIQTRYAIEKEEILFGKTELNLNKVIEMINYLFEKVNSLHKVKLMKMLWYSDALHFKRSENSVSGLLYNALDIEAVPEDAD